MLPALATRWGVFMLGSRAFAAFLLGVFLLLVFGSEDTLLFCICLRSSGLGLFFILFLSAEDFDLLQK